MSIQLPEWVSKTFEVTTGDGFPQADEDRLRQLAALWKETGQGLQGLMEEVTAATNAAASLVRGPASVQFISTMRSLTAGDAAAIPSLAQNCLDLADFVDKTALDVEYTKWLVIGQMVMLAAQIAWALATSAFNFGISLPMIPVLQALGRTLAGRLIMMLIQQILVGLIMQIGLDAITQIAQFAAKTRTAWDWQKTGGAAISGLVGAGVGMFLHGLFNGVINPLGKAAANAIENAADNSAEAAAKSAGKALFTPLAEKPAWVFTKHAVDFSSEVLRGATHEWLTDYMATGIQEGDWDPTHVTVFDLTAGGLEEVFEAMSHRSGRGIRLGIGLATGLSKGNQFAGLAKLPPIGIDAVANLGLPPPGKQLPQTLAGLNQVDFGTANQAALAALREMQAAQLPAEIVLPTAKDGTALSQAALDALSQVDFSRLTQAQLEALDKVDFAKLTPAALHAVQQIGTGGLTRQDVQALAKLDPMDLNSKARAALRETDWTKVGGTGLAVLAGTEPKNVLAGSINALPTLFPAQTADGIGSNGAAQDGTAPPPYSAAPLPGEQILDPQTGTPTDGPGGTPGSGTPGGTGAIGDTAVNGDTASAGTTGETGVTGDTPVNGNAASTGAPGELPGTEIPGTEATGGTVANGGSPDTGPLGAGTAAPQFRTSVPDTWQALADLRSIWGKPLPAEWWQALSQVDFSSVSHADLRALVGQELTTPPSNVQLPATLTGAELSPSAKLVLAAVDWTQVSPETVATLSGMDLSAIGPTAAHLAAQIGQDGFTAEAAAALAAFDLTSLSPDVRRAISTVDVTKLSAAQLTSLAAAEPGEITTEQLAALPQLEADQAPPAFDPAGAAVREIGDGVYHVEGLGDPPDLSGLPQVPDALVLSVEGEGGRFRIGNALVGASELADVIRGLPGWRPGSGRRLVLVSDHAAAGPAGTSLAAALAQDLGVDVVASTGVGTASIAVSLDGIPGEWTLSPADGSPARPLGASLAAAAAVLANESTLLRDLGSTAVGSTASTIAGKAALNVGGTGQTGSTKSGTPFASTTPATMTTSSNGQSEGDGSRRSTGSTPNGSVGGRSRDGKGRFTSSSISAALSGQPATTPSTSPESTADSTTPTMPTASTTTTAPQAASLPPDGTHGQLAGGHGYFFAGPGDSAAALAEAKAALPLFENGYVVAAHMTPDGQRVVLSDGRTLTVTEFAALLPTLPGYTAGMPIVLVACNAALVPPGGRSFADGLSLTMAADVWAATSDVWQTKDGRVLATGTTAFTGGKMLPARGRDGAGTSRSPASSR
jgi:hypothetical protein